MSDSKLASSDFGNKRNNRSLPIAHRVDPELYEKLKTLLRKERTTIGDWLEKKMEEDIKKHGDGNPMYTLDHFTNDRFLATPAFLRPISVWKSYLLKCSDKDYKEWYTQLESLLHLERQVTNQR